MDKLNPNQQRFCEEYVVDLNGQAAAERAGYSKKTAKVTASRLLTHANVKAEIARLQAKVSKRTGANADMVIGELVSVVTHNVQDFLTTENTIENLLNISREKCAAVSGIKITESANGDKAVELKFYDKVAAADKLAKHLGLYEKNNNQKVTKIVVKKK